MGIYVIFVKRPYTIFKYNGYCPAVKAALSRQIVVET